MTVKILSHLEYDLDVFRAIITSGDVDGAKPGTEAFFRLRAMLGESFESMLSVGDRKEVDIDPMLALGGSGILIDGPREIVTLANILLE
jgi:FMN phosphatase YigB (HAD superfamily)